MHDKISVKLKLNSKSGKQEKVGKIQAKTVIRVHINTQEKDTHKIGKRKIINSIKKKKKHNREFIKHSESNYLLEKSPSSQTY